MGKNQGAKKGTKIDLASLVGNNKAHLPDKPMERAPDDNGYFRRDFRGARRRGRRVSSIPPPPRIRFLSA